MRTRLLAVAALLAATAYCELVAVMLGLVAVTRAHTTLPYALLATWGVMMLFAVVFMKTKSCPLPDSYFMPRPFENNGRVYRWTGIGGFVWGLRAIGWERMQRAAVPVRKSPRALEAYLEAMRVGESAHLIAAAFTALFSLAVALRFSLSETKWLWAWNLLLNGYPIVIQRHNRPRVIALLRRFSRETP